jgi:AraC family transcriptional regulator of arabinose operon
MLVARLQLDLCLLDGFCDTSNAIGDFRLELAIEFLRSHLDEPEPVGRLCEYLHISDASLRRLFHIHTGRSPRDFVFEWRMRWANEELQRETASVKSVAYALGYRHPNDFSRAFKRFHGRNASELLTP